MKAFYCVGTHWDREWYKTFQEFRMWLVECVDKAMDLLENEETFRAFHLDGQTIVVDDYLQIRPESRERFLKLVKERRILIGPWYNLPDEWLLSGESLIRNLMRGFRDCARLGVKPLDYAYTPDQFGHIAALPMIMGGFGFKAGIVWRGAQDENYPAQFLWEAPDGTAMAYCKLSDVGSYGPFDFQVRRPVRADGFTEESFRKHFEKYLESEKARNSVPLVLMLDAIDHQDPDPEMVQIFKELRRLYPHIEFVWSSLEDFGDELIKHKQSYPVRKGELREPVRDSDRYGHYLIVHTLSSRVDIKKRNDQCSALLEKWCEPVLLMAAMNGIHFPETYLEKSWEYLMKNHPHDSICGCSIEQVHRDMHYRYDQSELIAEGLVRRAVAALGEAAADDGKWQHITVHNPLPYARKGVYDLALYFPSDYGQTTGHIYHDGLATGERYNKFHLVRSDGQRLTYQHKRIERNLEVPRLNERGREMATPGDVYHVAVELELPPCGSTSFFIEGTNDATRTFGSLLTGPLSASNGVIEISLDNQGALSLETPDGQQYSGLLQYEDAGDCGDGWTRGIPVNDLVVRSYGSAVMTSIEENGPLRCTFRVERLLSVPSKIEKGTGFRSEERVDLQIIDRITLEKHSPFVKIRTIIRNSAQDHRLRVLFPTDCDASVTFAETPFAVVEREIEIPEESALWQERINEEKAFSTFFGVQDKDRGLAVLCPAGLHEYAALDTPRTELALTLFRGFAKTVGTQGETDGQLSGTLELEYALVPLTEKADPRQLIRHVSEMQAIPKHHESREAIPTKSHLYQLTQEAVMTALKRSADGTGGIVRFWNPTEKTVSDGFATTGELSGAWLCNLNEEKETEIPFSGSTIQITIPAFSLKTICFTWKHET